MKKTVMVAPLFILLLVGIGCSKPVAKPQSEQGMMPGGKAETTLETPHGSSAMKIDSGAELALSRIVLDGISYQPGPIVFSFKLYSEKGQELTDNDLKIEHEKKMHFLLVRDDMTQFQHLHPEYRDGRWKVEAKIVEKGLYQIYVDIAPQNEKAVVLRAPISIGGATEFGVNPTPSSNNSAEDKGITAVLALSPTPIRSNQEINLIYFLTKNWKPVSKIDPYLAAYGHVVLIKHNSPDDFFHVHPVTETAPTNGQVGFSATFPTAGRYTLYAQFKVAGLIKTFPITVDVN